MLKEFFIAPSILSADFSRLGDELRTIEVAEADWVHVDIMDGHFVPNMSMGRKALEACKKVSHLPLDVHLMVEYPEHFIKWYSQSGADHLTVHIEATPNIHRVLQHIKELGCKVGIAINPGTPESTLDAVLHMVDLILVMTVNPGFGAQRFLPETLQKIKKILSQLIYPGLCLLGGFRWLLVSILSLFPSVFCPLSSVIGYLAPDARNLNTPAKYYYPVTDKTTSPILRSTL